MSVDKAINEIDAAFFSSDHFHTESRLDEISEYLNRWRREVESIRSTLNEPED